MTKVLLENERQKAAFSPEDLAAIVHQGHDRLQHHRRLRNLVENHPILNRRDEIFLNHSDQYAKGLEKSKHFIELIRQHGITNTRDISVVLYSIAEVLPIDVHWSMFVPALESQCNDEQRMKWLSAAKEFKILGAYAQTELGHGSNVRGIETLATYDKGTEEFILHSPTITSRKWWPGGLGKTATHAIVYARLIFEKNDFGVHGFIVPLRDMQTHASLKGITIGDIGPKLGYKGNDNGYCSFNHVRIPRKNMLMRFAQVTPEGTYISPAHDKIGYFTMVKVRSGMISYAASVLAKATTITARYCVVRQQGFISQRDMQELQIINYQNVQADLFPLVAACFAFHFSGAKLLQDFQFVMQNLDSSGIEHLAELHSNSSALKAMSCGLAVDGIETCRRLCGGQGYAHTSGLPQLFMDFSPSTTYEGTSEILGQQVTRFLLKKLETAKNLTQTTEHLGRVAELLQCKCSAISTTDFLNSELLLLAFKIRAARMLSHVANGLDIDKRNGMSSQDAWSANLVKVIHASLAHAQLIVMSHFIEAIHRLKSHKIREIMQKLACLFGLALMKQHMGDFVGDFMTTDQGIMAHDAFLNLLPQIRPHVITLTDGWDFSDYTLNSELGRYDGDIYNALIKRVQDEPLNKNDVSFAFMKYMAPILQSSHL